MEKIFIKKNKSVFYSVFYQLSHGEIQTIATSMAFIATLSLIPLAAISLSIFHALGGLDSLYNLLQPRIYQYFELATSQIILEKITEVGQNLQSTSLGLTGFVPFLFTSIKLFYDIDQSIQKIWGIKKQRSLFKAISIYLLIVLFGPVVFAIALGIYTSLAFHFIPQVPILLLTFISSFIGLYFIYRYVPNCKVKEKYALISALVASLLGILAQWGYFYTMANILNYSKFYGSLASIPIFLIWILLIWFVFLLGVSLCAGLQKSLESV